MRKQPINDHLGSRATRKIVSSRHATPAGSVPNAGARARLSAKSGEALGKSASGRIRQHIQSLGGWRAKTLAKVRRLIHEADPEIIEECKWMKPSNPLGVPVWSRGGIVCTGEAYKQFVKLTFARGASLEDPRRLFNASLDGKTRRAIDIREGDEVDAGAIKALIRQAVMANLRARPSKAASSTKTAVKGGLGMPEAKSGTQQSPRKVVLLSGGNPQIAKGDGDAPVQAYIAAMPGWKRGLGERLDAIVTQNVPDVRKAVKWNSPFYGLHERGWFLSFHVFTRYVKVSFFSGRFLRPMPPGGTPKSKDARWIDLYDAGTLDEAQMTRWVKQAAALPGWVP